MNGPEDHSAQPDSYRSPDDTKPPHHGGSEPASEVYERSLSWVGQFGYILVGMLLVLIPLLAFVEYVIDAPEPASPSSPQSYALSLVVIVAAAAGFSLLGKRLQEALVRRYSGQSPPIQSRARARARVKEVGAGERAVVTLCYVPGARFSPGQFALVALTPTILALVLLPALFVVAWLYLVPFVYIGVGVLLGFTLHHLHYAVWALRQPRGTTIALTDDPTTVRAYHPPATTSSSLPS